LLTASFDTPIRFQTDRGGDVFQQTEHSFFGVGSLAGRPIVLAPFIGAGTAEAHGGGFGGRGFQDRGFRGRIWLLLPDRIRYDLLLLIRQRCCATGPQC
jgi:hypothetical protein